MRQFACVDVEMSEKELSFYTELSTTCQVFTDARDEYTCKTLTDKIVAEENTPEEIVVTPSEDKRVTKVPTEMLRMLVLCLWMMIMGHTCSATINGFALYNGKQAIYISLADAKKDKGLLAYLSSDMPHKYGFDVKRNFTFSTKRRFNSEFP